VLQQDFEVVGLVKHGDRVLDSSLQLKPDVIVLDISMGAVSGIKVAQDLRASGCESRIVFLTVHNEPDYVQAAMGAGGLGYVVKSRLSADLVSAIRAVLSGKLFISASLL
jgi:DNA-binding NarL/FixJ family response regulator